MTLQEAQDRADAFMTAFLADMTTLQESQKASLGRYLQFLPTDPLIEGDSGGQDGLSVDVYQMPGNRHGWAARFKVAVGSEVRERVYQGKGPDAARAHAWRNPQEDRIP